MPNTLTISVRDKGGANIAELFDALEQGLMTADGTTMELGPVGTALMTADAGTTEFGAEGTALMTTDMGTLEFGAEGTALMTDAGTMELGPEGTALMSTDAGTMELRIDYTTIAGEVHATGLTVVDDGDVVWQGIYAEPQPLGFGSWGMSTGTLFDPLLGDTRIDMKGSKGDDWATGSDFGDRFKLGGGNDAANGGDGDDLFKGGTGNDLLIGGADNDRLSGGNDNDLLILGTGNDRADGGRGNDVLILSSGQDVAKGGKGNDIFIVDSTADTDDPNVQARITDFSRDDLLVFTEFDVAMPEGFGGETLADLVNSTIDDFVWRETRNGVEIQAGDATLRLKGVSADEIDLDQLVFSIESTADTATLFDTGGPGGHLGTSLAGDPFLMIPENNGADTSFLDFGSDEASYDLWGGDFSGFVT
ncbi:hypothetical protein [Marinovum sp.]|uniref:calcium-binding protein n=1 Tax=Marinovum sp. TaxID=2024839 RepID=UPI002B26E48B|nr:hypothetical protein [Marinovum sp.]